MKKASMHINESFICSGCGKQVGVAKRTCRNHCPYCFVSRHVDGDVPGDRVALTTCNGRMYPTAYEIKNSDVKILFVCATCGKQHRNKRSDDDDVGNLDNWIRIYKPYFSR